MSAILTAPITVRFVFVASSCIVRVKIRRIVFIIDKKWQRYSRTLFIVSLSECRGASVLSYFYKCHTTVVFERFYTFLYVRNRFHRWSVIEVTRDVFRRNTRNVLETEAKGF